MRRSKVFHIRGKGSFLVRPGRDCRNDFERREGDCRSWSKWTRRCRKQRWWRCYGQTWDGRKEWWRTGSDRLCQENGISNQQHSLSEKLGHKITYSSEGRNTQVDYILLRRRRLKECSDTKVIIGESVAKQHRLVVSKLILWTKWRKEVKPEKRTKWWRLKEKVYYNRYVLWRRMWLTEGCEGRRHAVATPNRESRKEKKKKKKKKRYVLGDAHDVQ